MSSNVMSKNKKQLAGFKFSVLSVAAVMLILAAALAHAEAAGDRVPVPLTDPSRPAVVKASLLNGSITVKAYDGKEVIVEAKARGGESDSKTGMKRIQINSTGLAVEEENNQVSISADSHMRAIDLTISVPVHTSLNLRTVNDGNISVTGVDGELDVNDVNGEVTLTNVSGNAIAHALNGDVKVIFTRINQKPMAFSSLNGDIDVTFPADLKANVNLSSDRGEVYSDFDVQIQTKPPQQTVEDSRGQGGRYRVKLDKGVRGTINGGGQEIQFKNFNGSIYIRKAGAPRTKE
ncbi:MAG: hypothetical protein JWO13_3424 [Acidobacteriales bacterium]|nr:hypothetical protein [Terriglobales bacterium]